MTEAEPVRRAWHDRSRAFRELAIFVGALAFGVLLMPLAVHATGQSVLGDYHNGGLGAFYMDFLRGLKDGAKAFWAVALGPYVFVQLLRGAIALARGRPAHGLEM